MTARAYGLKQHYPMRVVSETCVDKMCAGLKTLVRMCRVGGRTALTRATIYLPYLLLCAMLLLGVTGWLLRVRPHALIISDVSKCHARFRIEISRLGAGLIGIYEGLPPAELSPVCSVVVRIPDFSEESKIGLPVLQRFSLLVGKLRNTPIEIMGYDSDDSRMVCVCSREKNGEVASRSEISQHAERRRFISAEHFDRRLCQYVSCGRMTGITQMAIKFKISNARWLLYSGEILRCVNLYPRPIRRRKGVFREFIGGVHRLPLLLRIGDIRSSQNNYRYSGESGYATIMSVQKIEGNLERLPHCYQQPHYFMSLLCGLASFIALGMASLCWGISERSTNDARQASFGLLGIIPLAASFWFVFQAFNLAFFGVAPCASIPLTHGPRNVCFSGPAHSDSRPVANVSLFGMPSNIIALRQQFIEVPNMIGDPGFHGRRDT